VTGFADQVYVLGRRSVVRTLRQPANVVAPLLFPMFLLAVNSGGLKAETKLPGFPTDSFVAFALAVPFIQGALFATMNAGTDLARDIQTGFLNRLTLTPMRGIAVLAGQLGGVVVLGLVQAAVYLGVGLAVGVRLASGPLGVLVLFVFALFVTLAFGALGAFAALRTGSGEAVQSLFPAFFVFLFISSMNIPRNLIEATWFRDLATANPVSYLLECVRSLIITGWDAEARALGFGIAASIAVVAMAAASWALRVRMARS
jgi:ABC-2 type transport system permease protein